MKPRVLLPVIILFFFMSGAYSQAGMWTWVKGSSSATSRPSFGTLGVEDSSNEPPGVYEPCDWTDTSGNFWFFGGENGVNEWGDLWKYNPTTNNWTWVNGTGMGNVAAVYGTQGVPAASNAPGSRGYGTPSWVDHNGDLWLYGGLADDETANDMWRYNIAANMWTWMEGDTTAANPVYGTLGVESATNTPGKRYECSATWVDSAGYLWLYGGSDNSGGNYYGDLWRYNISTNYWTWMGGSSVPNGDAFYGTMGVPGADNTPGGRQAYASWIDAAGNFWLYSGSGYGVLLNDMWKYNPVSGYWTWMAGTDLTGNPGNYGTQCTADTGLEGGARYETRSRWKDECGNFWFYGGFDFAVGEGYYNDLWYFNPVTLEWIFANGNSTDSGSSVFGTKGVPAAGNSPGGKGGAVGWRSKSGQLYLFGGFEYEIQYYNTLWEFTIDPSCGDISAAPPSINLGADTLYCSAFSRVLSAGSAGAVWSTGATAAQITVTLPGTYWATRTNGCGTSTDTIHITQSILALQADSVSTSCGQDNGSVSVTVISGTEPYTYLWNTGSSGDTLSSLFSGTYTVTVTDSTGCSASVSALVNSISSVDSVNISAGSNNICPGDSITICASSGFTTYIWNMGDSTQCFSTTLAGNYYVTAIEANGCSATSSPITINVLSPPPVVINISDDTLIAFGAVTYQWYYNGALLPGDTDSVLIAARSGEYSVEVSDSNGCLIMSNQENITGIATLENEMSLKVYPDPAADELNISFRLNSSVNLQITITDITGRRVANILDEKELSGNYLQRVNIIQLASAVYFLNFTSEIGSVNLKFVKE